MYQLTMSYAFWKTGRQDEEAVFDLFFRKCPFEGQFCIFAGISEVLQFIRNFRFSEKEIDYLRTIMPNCEEEFFEYLSKLDCAGIQVYAMKEGTICFPREPLIKVRGCLVTCQLLETTLLNLVNFPSLVTTNAARMKIAAGPSVTLLEFGLRRAQGPDGGYTASKYSIVGGFHGTSNVLAGFINPDVAVKGTHAHSFVLSYVSLEQIKNPTIAPKGGGDEVNFIEIVTRFRELLEFEHTNEGELASFIAYALSFPNGFMALIDSYDTVFSGNRNFIVVALALEHLGYTPIGIRLDSGNLAYFSKVIKEEWRRVSKAMNKPLLAKCKVAASNEINETKIKQLNDQQHEIDLFGIGTHLATCQEQPALGCVYKMVQIEGKPRIKLSSDIGKVTVPGEKIVYRLYGRAGFALVDLMMMKGENAPVAGQPILCINPDDFSKQVRVTPSVVKELHSLLWDYGNLTESLPTVKQSRDYVEQCFREISEEHTQLDKPNHHKYKVSISEHLYEFMKRLWDKERQIKELK